MLVDLQSWKAIKARKKLFSAATVLPSCHLNPSRLKRLPHLKEHGAISAIHIYRESRQLG